MKSIPRIVEQLSSTIEAARWFRTLVRGAFIAVALVIAGYPGAASIGAGASNVIIPPTLPQFLFVARHDAALSAYTVNSGNGRLVADNYALAQSEVFGMAVRRGGVFVYVSNNGTSTVSGFRVNSVLGVLTPIGAPVATGGSGPERSTI